MHLAGKSGLRRVSEEEEPENRCKAYCNKSRKNGSSKALSGKSEEAHEDGLMVVDGLVLDGSRSGRRLELRTRESHHHGIMIGNRGRDDTVPTRHSLD